ncbi:MAG: Mur ligase family protein [Alistipes sp.]
MAAAFYGHPSRAETRGHHRHQRQDHDRACSTTWCGHWAKAGLVSTVVYKVGERIVEATHTTPDPVRLNAMMREMADEGCEYCFMECSSHAIVQQRTRGLHFAGGIFSNITHDHLDYHKTFAEYIRAKKLFFDSLAKDAFALTNADDKNGRVMVQNTAAGVHTYSLRTMADFRCKIVEMHVDGMLLRIDGQEYGWAVDASTPITCWPSTARGSAGTRPRRSAARDEHAPCRERALRIRRAENGNTPSSTMRIRPTRWKTSSRPSGDPHPGAQ